MAIAVVTGASSGMGAEFCRALDSKGLDRIVAVARRADRLEMLSKELKTPVEAVSADLSTVDGVDMVVSRITEGSPEIGYLVNCAGFGRFGDSWEIPRDETRGMIAVNVSALVDITDACIPFMPRGSSVIEVCSASAYIPLERLNVYASTKAFVHSYCEGLRRELEGRGVAVLEVSPGWVETDFIRISTELHGVPEGVFKHTVTREQVVSQAMSDLSKGRRVSVCGPYNRFQVFVCRHMPRIALSVWRKSLQ